MDPFERLLSRASSSFSGHDANRALWEAREALEAEHSQVVSYEMIASEKIAWSDFLMTTIPRLTEHMVAKGLPMLGGPAALLSVWRGEEIFLFDSREFFAAVREIEELDEDQLWVRIGEWRSAAGLSVPPESERAKSRSVKASQALALAPAVSERNSLGDADVRISEDASEIRTDE